MPPPEVEKIMKRSQFRIVLLLGLSIVTFSEQANAHNENVHRRITESAFYASSGLSTFLTDNLGSTTVPIIAHPHGYPDYVVSFVQLPEAWLEWGAYYEDMEDPVYIPWIYAFDSPRCEDHFYTPTFPTRVPGQVPGLTDSTESYGILIQPVNNSYLWAAIRGIPPVGLVSPNDQTWQNARDYQYIALSSTTKAFRDEKLALTLDALGHVLHLNQDASQPDHVRNDNHKNEQHRYIENYGFENFQKMKSVWFAAPPPERRGWPHWNSAGFTKLLDFWDRGLYVGNISALRNALNADATTGPQLGLAEFSNGNFLGEDAIYAEYFPASSPEFGIHYFPFPKRNTGTQYKAVWQNPLTS